MVGPPKQLSDLARIEADVRITCRRCRFEQDWTREALAQHLRAIGGSTVWSEITRHLTCQRFGCGSGDLRALPVPYARRQPNLPRRVGRLDEKIVALALSILEAAVTTSSGGRVDTLEVRLALLVLHRYVRDGELVRGFFASAADAGRVAGKGLREPYDRLRRQLEELGLIAPKVLLERPQVWQWQSPTPPGWLRGRGAGPHEPANDGDE